MNIDLSIIIINWNTRKLLLQTIASVYANSPEPYTLEIIVVDNNSADGSQAALAETYPAVTLIANSDNRGFGPANNQGLELAKGRYSLLLNSDTIVQPNSLKRIITFMEAHPQVGLCGIQVLNLDGTFQGSYADYLSLRKEFLIVTALGRRLFNPFYPSYGPADSQESKPVDTIQGAFMFARTDALRKIGGLDEQFFMYGEENDLSLRLRKQGWQTYYLAEATVVHLGGQSTSLNMTKMAWQLQKSKVLLFRKHYGQLPALLFKGLVSLAVLTKFGFLSVRQLLKRKPLEKNWVNWSEFGRFLKSA